MNFVPMIDLTARDTAEGRAGIARRIDQACTASGFFTVTGHGVPPELVRRMYATTHAFFTQPDELKDHVATRPGASGFRRMGGTSARGSGEITPPDLCEAYGVHVTGELPEAERARLGDYWAPWQLANLWPETPEGFRETWLAYLTVMAELAGDLMRLFALALGREEDHFDRFFTHHVSSLVANYYYPQHKPPLPGQLRRGAHTDWGSLTILYQQDQLGGLQVRRGEHWLDVPAVPGGFVVNIGDLMALWTGGRWTSTVHRVTNPPHGDTADRISLPYFHQPNHDAVVEYPGGTVIAGEWIADKMRKTFATTP